MIPMSAFSTVKHRSDSTSQEDENKLLQSVQLWMDRLQLLTAITTFFASIDGILMNVIGVYRTSTGAFVAPAGNFTHACIAGALAFHISAATLSFVSSFILIRYKQVKANVSSTSPVATQTSITIPSLSSNPFLSHHIHVTDPTILHRFRIIDSLPHYLKSRLGVYYNSVESPTNIHDALATLIRCNTVCMWFCILGFLLGNLAIISYVWTYLPASVSTFTTVCLVAGATAGAYALF